MADSTEPQGERLVRIETKLDTVLAQHSTEITELKTRMDRVEATATEAKIAADKSVTPKALWTGLLGAAGLATGMSPLLDRIVNK